MIHATPVPILLDNYVWVLSNINSGSAVVVDPGEHAPVSAFLEKSGLECAAVFLTHHHSDHVGGATHIKEDWDCPVFGPVGEAISAVTQSVGEGDTVNVADLTFAVLSVRGHTRGHVAYLGHGYLLCGDALFAGGCGRIFEGTPKVMFESVSRLGTLDPETQVCCAHEYTVANLLFAANVEPDNGKLIDRLASAQATRAAGKPTLPSRLEDEVATNPFLRCRQPEVVEAASRHAGRALEPGVEVFTEIRRWKDDFR